jgi:hypothetical protein
MNPRLRPSARRWHAGKAGELVNTDEPTPNGAPMEAESPE